MKVGQIPLDPEVRRQIFGDNALRLFKLDRLEGRLNASMKATSAKARPSHVVGSVEDFPIGEHRVVTIGRREIGIFNIGGEAPRVAEHLPAPDRAAL